jgi:hypothetical protein
VRRIDMPEKQKSSGVLFIILMGVILLTTALLFRYGPGGANVSQGAEVQGSRGAEVQRSEGVGEKSAIRNPGWFNYGQK